MTYMKNLLTHYRTYKPSSVAWLGDMPAHRSIQRSKWLFQKMCPYGGIAGST